MAMRRAAGVAAGASEAEILERWACLHVASMYIDDQSTVSMDDALHDADGAPVLRDGVPQTRAWAHFEAVKRVLTRFGHESEPRKEQSPRTAAELLGVELNLTDERMRLASGKRSSYAALARAAANARVCPREDFESLMGKLTFAATCYPRGRQWLHAPWRAARAAFRTRDGGVPVSKAVRAALLVWAVELERDGHEGVPLAARAPPQPAAGDDAAVVYADAALECAGAGFGAWTVAGDELLFVQGEWSAAERCLLICDLELAASTLGMVALQPLVGGDTLYSYTDNTVAMAAMRCATPSTAAMQSMTAARTEWLLERRIVEATERITSHSNLWADMLSRDDVAGVVEQAAAMGLSARRVDVPTEWRALVARAAEAAEAHAAPALRAPQAPCGAPVRARAGREAESLRRVRAQSDEERSDMRQRYLDAGAADLRGGETEPGVKKWIKYCALGRGVLPFTRLDKNSPLEDKIEAEAMLRDYALWLALEEDVEGMPVRNVETVRKYISHVRRWHLRRFHTELCGDLATDLVAETVRGIRRMVAQKPKRVRWGVRTQDLSLAISSFLDGDDAESANWAAALSVAFCGLLRGAEFALQAKERFNPRVHLTRADVRFKTDDGGREYVVLTIRPAKGRPGRGKEVRLLLGGGGDLIDPVRALKRLWELDPVADELMAFTPLFRMSGAPLTVAAVRATVKALMGGLGLEPMRFGAHSLRIGGASAGLAAGLSEAALRAAGRWSSDVYQLYARASVEALRAMATVIGSTSFTDVEREFVEEELLYTTDDVTAAVARGGGDWADEDEL